MMIIIDSREKKYEHIEKYLNAKQIPYRVEKLDVGDYQSEDNPHITVDRKANLQEVCTNLSRGKENHSRFAKECKRAFDAKIRLIVLIEGTAYKELSDLKQWKSKYSKHTGRWMIDEMFKLSVAYGVEWKLCRKNETAKRILDILDYTEDE